MTNADLQRGGRAKRSLLRRAGTILISALAVVAVLLAAAFAVETARMHRLRAILPPGESYTIDGYKVHLDCTGTGAPTLLLEAGVGDDFLSWRRVQPALSRVTRVCSYDRAGYGWSAARPGPRDTDHVVEELHSLVGAAHIEGPMVLMGHSAGGLFIRKYATLYPEGIAGLVFVDASTPTQTERLPPEFNIVEDFTWDNRLLPFGIPRFRGHCGVADPQTPQVRSLLEFHDCSAQVFSTTVQEELDFAASAHEANNTGPFGQIPVLIFSQDPALRFGEPFTPAVDQQAADTWNTLQEELKQLSPRSRRIIARGSTHYVHVLRPELVIREVGHMMGEIRGSEPARGDYGSTTQ